MYKLWQPISVQLINIFLFYLLSIDVQLSYNQMHNDSSLLSSYYCHLFTVIHVNAYLAGHIVMNSLLVATT